MLNFLVSSLKFIILVISILIVSGLEVYVVFNFLMRQDYSDVSPYNPFSAVLISSIGATIFSLIVTVFNSAIAFYLFY